MRPLTDLQLAFCEEYVRNGFKRIDAYCFAYQLDNRVNASSSANALLKNPKIISKIEEIEGNYKTVGREVGVDKFFVLEKLKLLLNAKKPFYYNGQKVEDIDDYGAINAAITTYAKLTGDFAPEKTEVKINEQTDFDPEKMTEEEIEEKKKEILAGL